MGRYACTRGGQPVTRLAARSQTLRSSAHACSRALAPAANSDPSIKVGHKDSLDVRTMAYMRRADVQDALHAHDGGRAPRRGPWPGPVEGWTYTSQYAACNYAAPKNTTSMVDIYREIAPKLPNGVIVFNGDSDPCVSYEGTQEAVGQVGFGVREAFRPWFFNATAVSSQLLAKKDVLFGSSLTRQHEGAQLGGYVVDYEHGLSFATVHGSGHMVPQSRPQAALKLIRSLLAGRPLSPAFPSLPRLAAMSEAAYASFAEGWTYEARSRPYVE